MTAAVPAARELTLTLDGPAAVTCPRCRRPHRLTLDGRLWTHGPRTDRCPASALRVRTAAALLRTVDGRPIRTIDLPREDIR